jgi:hypothetical protein
VALRPRLAAGLPFSRTVAIITTIREVRLHAIRSLILYQLATCPPQHSRMLKESWPTAVWADVVLCKLWMNQRSCAAPSACRAPVVRDGPNALCEVRETPD